ncbi:MAG TPA: extracellular solute-binding protein, partial [Spirochaetia bacterium]|nr:extracellular solute-binding protein [Spirochaetia bacterium]
MKRLVWIVLAAAVTLLAVSCSKSSNSGASSSSASNGKATVVRVSWYGDENRNKTYNATFDVIQKMMPNVTIQREFAAASQYWTKMSTELAGGGAPDSMIFTLDNITDFADRGVLMNLQSFVDKGVIDTKDLDPSIIDSGKVKGILYGISQGNSIKGTYYDKTMFANAKVPDPSFGWSWDEFSNDMIAIHKALGPNVWGAEDDGGVSNLFQTFLKQRGKDLYSENGGLGFDKSDMIAWYTVWNNMRQQGGIPPADIST